MSKQHLRPKAKHLFMQGLTLDDIAELLPVSKTTLCDWSNRYRWKEQRDRLDVDPETISLELRQKLSNQVRKLKVEDEVDWDQMVKAATTLEKLGGITDEVASAVKSMDKFSRFVKAQKWSPEKVNHIFEGIRSFMDKVGEEAY